MKPYLAQIRSNIRLTLRDKSVLFFSLMFPAVFFFVFANVYEAKNNPAQMAKVIAMVLLIGVLGNGFFGAGLRTVAERETNILRRFKVAPVGPAPIIVASMVSGLVAYVPTFALFLIVAKVLYHDPLPPNIVSLTLFVMIGLVAFRSMGMIIAAVVNSAQEATILIQILYLPMLFLSGATFPVTFMPQWVQNIAHFLPATYLHEGIEAILIKQPEQSIIDNWPSVLGLLITTAVAMLVGIKLFRWEKEEKISGRAKLWIIAVLVPFIVMGVYQARTQDSVNQAQILNHQSARQRSVLFQHARIFVGDGTVIADGAVLIRNGKITQVFEQAPADPKNLQADVVDSAGKTLMPGMIDMHVHLGAPGGAFADQKNYMDPHAELRRLSAYLYSGITAVRSTGDWLNQSLTLKSQMASDRWDGAEPFICGPLFTAKGGHPEELLKYYPDNMRVQAEQQFLRQPKTEAEARAQVDELKKAGVDSIKAVLESGNEIWGNFNHLDPAIYKAIVDQATKDGLPVATHTGSLADINLAIEAGSSTVEHGAMMESIPADVFARMKAKNIAYDPTLSVYAGMAAMGAGKADLLDNSLLQSVGPADLLSGTKAMLAKSKPSHDLAYYQPLLDRLNKNLLTAYESGVTLITGTDAGNMLVIHGPTVQREMELWVKAGIPPAIALRSATFNAAQVLRADKRIGLIQPGKDATLILLDGDPVQDIGNTEHIHAVYFKGEHVDRSDLFDQYNP
jgi:imidazolonepropionase-like amidohydrolase/ABC-type multidrug transport system permease subunit